MNYYIYVNTDHSIAQVSTEQVPIEYFEAGIVEHVIADSHLLAQLNDGYTVDNLAKKGVDYKENLDNQGDPDGTFSLYYPEDQVFERTFGQYLTDKISETRAIFDANRQIISGSNDPIEVSGYLLKREIAAKIVADTASTEEIALVQSEVDERDVDGETVAILAQKQVDKANLLISSIYVMDGIQYDIKERMAEAEDEEEVDDLIDEANTRIAALIFSISS